MTWTIKGDPHSCKFPSKEDAANAGVVPREGDIWTCDLCGRRYELIIQRMVFPDRPDEWQWIFRHMKDA